MARIVVARQFGGPEVLEVVSEELAAPGPGEVHVQVRAAGINPADLKSRSGEFGSDPATLPRRFGYEAAGVVAEVGDGSRWAVGDEVIAFRIAGAYASDLVVPDDALTAKPVSLGWAPAGGLMLTGATAWHALTATGVGEGDRPGDQSDTVLVHGGAGGVGQMAVQLAVLRGARVIATASPRNHDLLRRLGAEPVEYGDALVDRVRELAPQGVSAALDLVGTDEAMDTSLALVADRDRIATIAAFERGAREGVKVLGGGPGADPGTEIRDAARPELAELAGDGRLQVNVAATFRLDQAADAHRLVGEGHASGKVVLLP